MNFIVPYSHSPVIDIPDGFDNILEEIEVLISKRKIIEKNFQRLRKKLLSRKKVSVINSTNWEDWKMLSLEYDEIKQIMNDVEEKLLSLKKLRKRLGKKKRTKLSYTKSIKIKRVYDGSEKDDGFRILVDRLWPRGLSKDKTKVDLWLKEVSPSDTLRKWFSHDPKKWLDFKIKYKKELKNKQDLLKKIKQVEKEYGIVTLLYSAKDEKHNNAVVLQEELKG